MLEHIKDLVRYRELIRNLTVRDLKVRYRNSLLGFFWTWGNPVLMTLVFYTVFKVLHRSPISNFALFIMIGWLVWGFTSSSISEGIGSVIGNASLIKKVYFPRETLPLSSVLSNASNFLLASPLIVVLVLVYQINLQPALLVYFPIIFVSQFALVLGVTLILSAVNVFYRDTAVITSVLLTAWFFLTPVFYPVSDVVGADYSNTLGRLWYILNPMASIIEGYRNIFYGSAVGGPPAAPNFEFLLRTVVTSFAVLIIGYIVFLRLSRRFGEEV